jgi:hypothetical protein
MNMLIAAAMALPMFTSLKRIDIVSLNDKVTPTKVVIRKFCAQTSASFDPNEFVRCKQHDDILRLQRKNSFDFLFLVG